MGLPCYKLNNSYTVYVNYHYLNECIQVGKKYAHTKQTKKVKCAARTNTIGIGSTVSLLNLNTNQQCTLALAQSESITVGANIISSASPVGAALIGKAVGDHITVNVPAGIVKYQIISLAN